MKVLGIVTWIFLATLINALVIATSTQHLWAWFVSAEYGSGPSLGAWFGIAAIMGFVIGMYVPRTKPEPDDARNVIRSLMVDSFARWIIVGVAMLLTYGAGNILGWVR